MHSDKRKNVYRLEKKEIQEETIQGVNTMVLAHNIDWSKDYLIVMKPAQEKIEKIDQCLRIQPLRGGNLLYIT